MAAWMTTSQCRLHSGRTRKRQLSERGAAVAAQDPDDLCLALFIYFSVFFWSLNWFNDLCLICLAMLVIVCCWSVIGLWAILMSCWLFSLWGCSEIITDHAAYFIWKETLLDAIAIYSVKILPCSWIAGSTSLISWGNEEYEDDYLFGNMASQLGDANSTIQFSRYCWWMSGCELKRIAWCTCGAPHNRWINNLSTPKTAPMKSYSVMNINCSLLRYVNRL